MSAPASPFPAALSLMQIVDAGDARLGDRIDAAIEGGVTCLWLRAPEASGREVYEAAGALVLRCRRLGAALLVGDRVDVALAVGADGVQIGNRGVPPRAVRPWYRGWMGVSCHSAEELAAAETAGADHVVLSPIFGVPKKGEALGLARFGALVAPLSIPAVGLGGVDAGTVESVRRAGAAGVAVIRAIRDAQDAGQAARQLSRVVTSR